jgi:hypothetical protein
MAARRLIQTLFNFMLSLPCLPFNTD